MQQWWHYSANQISVAVHLATKNSQVPINKRSHIYTCRAVKNEATAKHLNSSNGTSSQQGVLAHLKVTWADKAKG